MKRLWLVTSILHSTQKLSVKTVVRVLFVVLAVSSFTLSLLPYTRNAHAYAATSNTINFQARTLQPSGAVVVDGSYTVVFKLYTSASGGSALWTESDTVTTKNGYMSVSLGAVTPFPSTIQWDQQLYLGMTIGSDSEMTPRMKITSVPFAQAANQLQVSSGANTSTLNLTAPTGGSQVFQIQDQTSAGTFNLLPLGTPIAQVDTSTNTSIFVNKTGASGNLINLQASGISQFSVSSSGALTTVGAINGLTLSASSLTTATTNGSLSIQSNGTGTLALDTGSTSTSVINIGATNATTINIGNTTGASTTNINAGTGKVNVNGTLSLNSNILLPTPSAPTVFGSGAGSGTASYTYAVIAVGSNGGLSLASPTMTISNTSTNPTLSGSFWNTINWSSVSGAGSYRVYRTAVSGGTPSSTGLIGTTTTTSLKDTGLTADGSTYNSTANTAGLSVIDSVNTNYLSLGSTTTLGLGLSHSGTTTTNYGAMLNATGTNTYSSATTAIPSSYLTSASSLAIAAPSTGITYTLPTLTSADTGRTIYVYSSGTNAFLLTVGGTSLNFTTTSTATLFWNGTTWTSAGLDSGATSIGALDGGTANGTGATLLNNTLYLQSASATNAGLINTGAQTFAGAKTFNSSVTASSLLLSSTTGLDTNSAIALNIGTSTATGVNIGSTASNTINIGTTIATSNTQAINIGSSLNGTTNINIGYRSGGTNSNGATNIYGGNSVSITTSVTGGGWSGPGGSISVLGGGNTGLVTIGAGMYSASITNTGLASSTYGLVLTGGATSADISTPSVVNSGTASSNTTALTIQPGSVSGGCSQAGLCGANGAALNLYGGYTGTGLGTGGSVNIAGGGGLGGGSINLMVGTGYSNGSINIATNGNGWIFAGQNGGTQRVGIDNTSPSYVLDVGNSAVSGVVARFVNSTGSCTINPTTTSLSCSSDETLKKDITSYNPNTALNDLLGLTAVTYHWNSEDSSSDPTHTGFIAQEVQKILPDLISTDDSTGLLSLSYAGLTPYIVAGMQAQQQQINQTKSDVTLLQTAANIINGGVVNGDLSITGSMNVVGNLNATGPVTLSSSLTVNGDVTFLGNLTVQDISVKNITINGHIITAGNTPTITPGSAAGTADTQNNIPAPQVTIEGNDTAGTITITTGANTTAGILASVTFSEAYGRTPRVIISADDSGSADLSIFKNSTATQFMISTTNAPLANTEYKLDYLIAQ